MPLNPPPVIHSGVGLIVQPMQRSDMARAALVTACVVTVTVPTFAVAQTMVDAWQTHWNTRMAPVTDTEVTIGKPTIKLGKGDTVPFEATASGAAINGAAADVFLPPNCALLVKKQTEFGGRSNRGRWYVPFMLNAAFVSENGTITSGYVGARQTDFNNLLADLATANIPLYIENKVVDHSFTPPRVTNINASAEAVSTLTVENMIATQRRRLGRS